MQRERLTRLYDLHAWIGVITGLFIFIVSFSGSVALFGDEISTWEDPVTRLQVSDQPIEITPLLDSFVNEVTANGQLTSLSLRYPTIHTPYYHGFANIKSDQETVLHTRRWNSHTGEIIPERGEGLAHWLVEFHAELMLPNRTLGRSLVGVAGVLLLLSIITGILTHQKIIKELFSWRMNKTMRVRWKDTHNVIGIWGLPFHTMIAFTGAFLGIVALLVPLIGVTAFKGDQGAVMRAVNGEPTVASGISAPMFSLTQAQGKVREATQREPYFVLIKHWQDQNAEYEVFYPPEKELVRFAHIEMSGVTGEMSAPIISPLPSVAGRIAASLTPLHYATYGGITLKLLYFVLGITLCIVIATGLTLWIERRLHGNLGKRSPRYYQTLSRLISGATSGMVLSSIALFYVDRLIDVAPTQRLTWIGSSYFLIWAFAIVYALFRDNSYRTNKHLLGLSALALIGLPVLDYLTSQAHIISQWQQQHIAAASTNLIAFVVGVILLIALSRLPNQRPQKVIPQ